MPAATAQARTRAGWSVMTKVCHRLIDARFVLAPYSRSRKGDIMTNTDDGQHRSILQRIAHRAMLERGLVPDFPSPALAELDGIHGACSLDPVFKRRMFNEE